MKKLTSSITIAHVGLLKGVLEQEGIPCLIKNESLTMTSGFVPFTECFPELWVVNDEDLSKAQEVLDNFQTPEPGLHKDWRCATCGEDNEGQFALCWSCGREAER